MVSKSLTAEQLIIWTQEDTGKDVRKTWGTIQAGLPKGEYLLTLKNNFDTGFFGVKKQVELSQARADRKFSFGRAALYVCVGTLVVASVYLSPRYHQD